MSSVLKNSNKDLAVGDRVSCALPTMEEEVEKPEKEEGPGSGIYVLSRSLNMNMYCYIINFI